MPARFLIIILCLSPLISFSKEDDVIEKDMELFEFLAMYEQDDVIFIDAEIDDKDESDKKLVIQNAITSESNE